MPYGPDDPQPQVWCGCQTRMKLDSTRKPHGFICPNCGGCCDVIPPSTDRWEWHACGAIIKGGRCLNKVPEHYRVCMNCEKAIVQGLHSTNPGRQFLLDLVGRRAVKEHEEQLLRETQQRKAGEAAARAISKEAARTEGPGHVVYYCRLGANHIKIGTTKDLPRRMVELRVVNVGNLLAAEPGGYDLETQRHDQFKKWRYNRRKEDFGEGPDLLEHIRSVRAEHGDPYELAARLLIGTQAA